MKMPRAVLWLSILTFGGFGLAFTLFPSGMASFVELSLAAPTARIDFAATYGGLELGIAAFLAFCTGRDDRVYLGLVLSGLALAGLGTVRLLGLLVGEEVQPILYLLLSAEAVGSALSFWAARHARIHLRIRQVSAVPGRR